jgi:hypothetical protein
MQSELISYLLHFPAPWLSMNYLASGVSISSFVNEKINSGVVSRGISA